MSVQQRVHSIYGLEIVQESVEIRSHFNLAFQTAKSRWLPVSRFFVLFQQKINEVHNLIFELVGKLVDLCIKIGISTLPVVCTKDTVNLAFCSEPAILPNYKDSKQAFNNFYIPLIRQHVKSDTLTGIFFEN